MGSDDEGVRELMDRATSGVHEIDLVPAALAGARMRRRRRTAVGLGGAVAAAVLVGALALTTMEPGDVGPADPATQSPMDPISADALEANRRLVKAIFTSGIAIDYQPLASPEEAMAAPLVVVGEIRSARVARGQAGPEVRLVVDVTRHLAGDEETSMVEAAFNIGGGFDLSQHELDEARGPVLLVVDNLLPEGDPGDPRRAYPHVDGAWFDVPGGIAGPYARSDEMQGDWPQARSVTELADALTSLPSRGER